MEIAFKQVYDNNVQNHILWYMLFFKKLNKTIKSWDINCAWVIIEKLWDTFVTGIIQQKSLDWINFTAGTYM